MENIEQHIAGIPNGYYHINAYDDGNTFLLLDTETKTVSGYYYTPADCGCCSDINETDWNWENMTDDAKQAVIDEALRYIDRQESDRIFGI